MFSTKYTSTSSFTASDGEFHPPANSVSTSFSGFYSFSHSDHHIAPHPESKVISEVVYPVNERVR